MKKIFLFLLTTAFLLHGQAQKAVYQLPLDSGKTISGNTLCYMLPTTALKMTVTVTKVREIKGYYADYAETLLGLKNTISENKTFYRIKNVNIQPTTIPDTKNAYLALLSGAQMKNNELVLAAKRANFIPDLAQVNVYTTQSTPIPNFFKNYSDPSYTEMEDSFVETKIIDGVVTQVPANRTKLVSRSTNQKAQEAADAISKSRKDQYNLVAGEQEVAYSSEALNIMLSELKQWEDNYLSLFKGIILEDELEYTFYVVPENTEDLAVFTFDQEKGLSTDALSNTGKVYTLSFQPIFPTAPVEEAIATGMKASKNNGFRFRTAMPVQITLHHQQNQVHDFGIIDMFQCGRIQTLPANLNGIDFSNIGFIF